MSTTGQQERDEGIRQVASTHSKWREGALNTARAYLRQNVGSHLTGEDITTAIKTVDGEPVRDNGEPGHHNIFGGIANTLIHEGFLATTGERWSMKLPGSHARQTAVYLVCAR